MPKLQRINTILQERGISMQAFAQEIGMSESGVKQMIKRNSTRIQTLERIAEVLNCPMDYFFQTREPQKRKSSSTEQKKVPHIPYSAQAGSLSGFSEAALSDNCMLYPSIDFLGSYDFTIDIQGDSMIPLYENGDTIACKRLFDGQDMRNEKIYVLDTAQGIVIKKVERQEKNSQSVTCVSLNEAYDPFELSLEDIYGISEVIAVVKKQ